METITIKKDNEIEEVERVINTAINVEKDTERDVLEEDAGMENIQEDKEMKKMRTRMKSKKRLEI